MRDRWPFASAAFLMALAAFLAVRAAGEYRWSDWGFGDAQTLMSLRNWREGGWVHNRLLFRPQGYAAAADSFDEPALRHHAHGLCPVSSPRVGPRLLYTHYPVGYLVPYAVLSKAGSVFSLRLLSILFSMGGMVCFGLTVGRLLGPAEAFFALLAYGLSPAFLGYADSLAYQPLDDLLRFAFMLAVVEERAAAAWLLEFALSLASLDYVLYAYVWLVGWDLLRGRARWRRWMIFALAPAAAHSLQLLQNVWYLGRHDAWIDLKDALFLKTAAAPAAGFLSALAVVFRRLGFPLAFAVALAAGGFYCAPGGRRLAALLLACGAALCAALPGQAALMAYEGRQQLPFLALLAALSTGAFIQGFAQGGRKLGRFALSTFLMFALWGRLAVLDRSPAVTVSPENEDIRLALGLSRLKTSREPIFFDLGAFSTYWMPGYMPGFPQIHPLIEYYAGERPILSFDDPRQAGKDLRTLSRLSRTPFSPVLVARDEAALRAAVGGGRLPTIVPLGTRVAADLTGFAGR